MITIIDTKPIHVRQMAVVMHEQSADTARKMGYEPRKLLWKSYKQSIMCKSIFINDEIVAMFGLGGSIFGKTGYPWLIMIPEVEKQPFRVAFIYRKELEKMQEIFPVLEEYVEENNIKAIRLLELMKFHVSKNKVKIGNATFRRAERAA